VGRKGGGVAGLCLLVCWCVRTPGRSFESMVVVAGQRTRAARALPAGTERRQPRAANLVCTFAPPRVPSICVVLLWVSAGRLPGCFSRVTVVADRPLETARAGSFGAQLCVPLQVTCVARQLVKLRKLTWSKK
jgi:hypothetical protein